MQAAQLCASRGRGRASRPTPRALRARDGRGRECRGCSYKQSIEGRAVAASLSPSLTLALPLYDLPLRLHLANSRATPSASQKRASQRRAASTSESLQAFASPLLRLNKSLCVNETCYLQPPCSP